MKKVNHDLLLPLGMVVLTILTGAFLISNKVNADDTDVVDQVNIIVPTSCTMSGTGMNSHTANINNNTYTPNIGTTTLHAFCNDNGGFTIYAVGYTDTCFLVLPNLSYLTTPSTVEYRVSSFPRLTLIPGKTLVPR